MCREQEPYVEYSVACVEGRKHLQRVVGIIQKAVGLFIWKEVLRIGGGCDGIYVCVSVMIYEGKNNSSLLDLTEVITFTEEPFTFSLAY